MGISFSLSRVWKDYIINNFILFLPRKEYIIEGSSRGAITTSFICLFQFSFLWKESYHRMVDGRKYFQYVYIYIYGPHTYWRFCVDVNLKTSYLLHHAKNHAHLIDNQIWEVLSWINKINTFFIHPNLCGLKWRSLL